MDQSHATIIAGQQDTAGLVLASASPRRMKLLEDAGIKLLALRPSSIDETPKKKEMPRVLVQRLAVEKVKASVASIEEGSPLKGQFFLAADTVVALGRRVLGKPADAQEAMHYLKKLSGRSHRVLTGVAIYTPGKKIRQRVIETKVTFRRLSSAEIETYALTGEWQDKAGGYAIQGIAGAFVRQINGSYTNVVGLPVSKVLAMLQGDGFPVTKHWAEYAGIIKS